MKRLLFFLLPAYSISQTTHTLTLYYRINETISGAHIARLDSFVKSYHGQELKVKVTGSADFLSSDKYNFELSEKRARHVCDHLRKSPVITVLSCRGIGEKNSTPSGSASGEPLQRKVDVIIEWPQVKKDSAARKNIARVPPSIHKPQAKIEELKKGESAELQGLSFIPGRHFVLKSSMPVLENLLKTLQDHPDLTIEIQGHVCCTENGNDGYDFDSEDRKLSLNRARYVYEYLVQNGIDENRLSYKGFGHTRPKNKYERTPEEEQENRRVEIMVTGK